MDRKIKWLIVVTIGSIFAIGLTFILKGRHLEVPKVEQISSAEFINVVNGQGVEKVTISQQSDINNLLNILRNSEKTNKDSISDFPDKRKFTIIRFNLLEGSNWRSIYEENSDVYVDQPYVGIFKLNFRDFNLLNEIMERGDRESISIQVDEILKSNS